jgi:hypothetical protein
MVARCDRLIEYYGRTKDLIEDWKVIEDPKKKEELRKEIEARKARRSRLSEKELGQMTLIEDRVNTVMRGELPLSIVTAEDIQWMEDLYAKGKSWRSPAEEASLRAQIRKQAVADHEAGRFPTLNDALEHYNLRKEETKNA